MQATSEEEENWWWFWSPTAQPKNHKQEKVRTYWGDAALEEAPAKRTSREKTSAEIFATDALDETELAELGRELLKVESVEEKARLTREFIERVKTVPQEVTWRQKVDKMRQDLMSDKKKLATRQKQRATFLMDEKTAEHDAKQRELLSKQRLNDIRRKRRTSFFNFGRRSHMTDDVLTADVLLGGGAGANHQEPPTPPAKEKKTGRPTTTTTTRKKPQQLKKYDPDFPPPPAADEEDDDYEQRAVVDLFWKGQDDVVS